MIDTDEMLGVLRELKREEKRRDYISLLELYPKLKMKGKDWTQEEVRDVINKLRRMGKIRITDNFQIRL